MEHTSATLLFPLILAGPMLRHVTPHEVNVWLASSRPLALRLEVYNHDGELIGSSTTADSPIARPTQKAAQPLQNDAPLGDNLHITLIQARPTRTGTPFPDDQLLSYALIDTTTEQALDLDDVCLTGEPRPTFRIPTELSVLAYGSCRKPHGPAKGDDGTVQQADSLALLARHLDSHQHVPDERPDVLFLVGDQIYADDVLPPLMEYAQQTAPHLLGKDIQLPHEGTISHHTAKERKSLKKRLGLTSDVENGHVLNFAEYAVLYLVSFGNRINFQLTLDANSTDEERSLHHFLNSQAEVRKVFANIPTYMNFDDHDVTDDWNLSRPWYDRVRNNPTSTRVIANAQAAYWAFQGWGNNPSAYSRAFRDTVIWHLNTPDEPTLANAFDFQLWKFSQWGYVLNTQPPIFVMDTRTQRNYGGYAEPAQLLDRYALNNLREAWSTLEQTHAKTAHDTSSDITPIFITGTPVFGFSVIEWAQSFLYRLGLIAGKVFAASKLDVESWIANPRGFSSFLNTLLIHLKLKKATFISGDVHYSFVNRATYTNHCQQGLQANNKPKHLHCLQLTSSAMRNTPGASRYMETFLANWIKKRRRGHCQPESLPWWRQFLVWRLSRDNTWVIEVSGIPGFDLQPHPQTSFWRRLLMKVLIWRSVQAKDGKIPNWITSRPNVALVYFRNQEAVKQVLLSGDDGSHGIRYDFRDDSNDDKK